jgi:hypothetical protein
VAGRLKKTLSSLFAPPENLQSIGGALCAFSSDADLLEQALFRFTRVPPGSRRSRGSVDFTLMLDPAHEVLAQDVVPGLLQLRPKSSEQRIWKFRDMHAKVALLAFGPARMGEPSQYRILVSTGNWTKASAQQFIEMVWHIDIHAQSSKQDQWELHAIASFLQGLLGCYQTGEAMKVHELIRKATAFGAKLPARATLQFMQSSGQALLPQIAKGLKDKANACNYLVCGSGFFEQKHDPQEQPKVLSDLVIQFQKDGILTQSIDNKVIVTNGDQEDQVIAAYRSKALIGWNLHHPKDPVSDKDKPRTQLHAKFLFVAKNRAGRLSSCWLYLGSGNLSKRGMLLAPSHGGNIETGVLIKVDELDTPQKVLRLLPVGNKFKPNELDGVVLEIGEPTSKEPDQPPSPIIYFQVLNNGLLSIIWDPEVLTTGELAVILPDGTRQILQPLQATLSLNSLEWPRSLEIQWNGSSCKVPCLDVAGDFKRQTIKNPSFGNWLDLLRGFPETLHDPDPDEEDESDSGAENPTAPQGAGAQWDIQSGGRDFPAHTAMMLVETIADRNGSVPEESAADWLHYLRHILLEECPDSQIEGWKLLQVNFLVALLNPEGFAPTWNDLAAYRALIQQVATEWGLEEFPTLEMMA